MVRGGSEYSERLEHFSLCVHSHTKSELAWHKRIGLFFKRSVKHNEEARRRKAAMGLISSFG